MTRFVILASLFLLACEDPVQEVVPTSVVSSLNTPTKVTMWVRTYDADGNELPCTAEYRMFFRTRVGALQPEKGEAMLHTCKEDLLPAQARIGQTIYQFDLIAWMPIEVYLADADGKMVGVPSIIQLHDAEKGTTAQRFVSVVVK